MSYQEHTPVEGQKLGNYTMCEHLHDTYFGSVYRVQEAETSREVALTIIHPPVPANPQFARRFLAALQPVVYLQHPHIVGIDAVAYADGHVGIATELTQASTLAQVIQRRGRIRWEEMLATLQPICAALDAAHQQGIAHGDLTPHTILLDAERGPLLSNVGLVPALNTAGAGQYSDLLVTPHYAAPERWHDAAPTAMTDIYALGCIVYEMLSGNQLFQGKSSEHLQQAHEHGPQFPTTWPEKLPPEVEAMLYTALAHNPQDRYASAGAIWQDLNDFTIATHQTKEQLPQASPLWSRVLPIATWILITLLVLALIRVAAGIGEANSGAYATPLLLATEMAEVL